MHVVYFLNKMTVFISHSKSTEKVLYSVGSHLKPNHFKDKNIKLYMIKSKASTILQLQTIFPACYKPQRDFDD